MSHDVFICHASEDRAIANAICSRLEQDRIRCWIAPRDVLPGSEYARSIVEAISGAKLTVLVFSDNSNSSPHVRREIERTASHGIPILPFRLDEVTPSPALEYFISDAHWLDALTPPLEEHLDHLVGTVRVLLEREASAQLIPPPPSAGVTPGAPPSPAPGRPPPASGGEPGAASERRSRPWWPWALLGGLALVAAIVAGFVLLGSDSGSGAQSYGDDPELDALWDACEAGDGEACDDLFLEAPTDSDYGDFGFTCGDRYDGGELCAEVMATTVPPATSESAPSSAGALQGTVSVDPTSVSGAQPVTVSYSITNSSGGPIEAATTEILVVVGTDPELSGVVLADVSQDIAAGATVDGTVQTDLLGTDLGAQRIGIVSGTRIAGGTTDSQVVAETPITVTG
jgi:hypothetical protein